MLLFDIEADAIELEQVKNLWCIAVKPWGSGEVETYGPDKLDEGVARLHDQEVCAHNSVRYDVPTLQKFYPEFQPSFTWDSLLASQVRYPGNELFVEDQRFKRFNLPRLGAHSLEGWGIRLGELKGEKPSFDEYSPELLDYCSQDVRVLEKLLDRLEPEMDPWRLECLVAHEAYLLHRRGVAFSVDGAEELTRTLTKQTSDIRGRLREQLVPKVWSHKGKPVTPKRTAGPRREGATYQPIKCEPFDPMKRAHLARALKVKYGWESPQLTKTKQPQLAENILSSLDFPEIPDILKYLEGRKLLGYLTDGKNAWLGLVREGRIHGDVVPVGAASHRTASRRPNLAQVPTRTDVGKQCRELFTAPEGWYLVGADAGSLQLRLLGHYLAECGDDRFAKIVASEDIHESIKQRAGFYERDNAKTYIYAKIFGAQKRKLESIRRKDAAGRPRKAAKDTEPIPGMARLEKALARATKRGYALGLDGRKIPIPSERLALSRLLQAGEAVVMKSAWVDMGQRLRLDRFKSGVVLFVHDEFQTETHPDEIESVKEMSVDAITKQARVYNLQVPLEVEAKVGKNWRETH